MGTKSEKAYTCRLPSRETQLMELAKRTTGMDRAALLRRAFRYYVSRNPDQVAVFADQSISAERAAIQESGLFDHVADAVDAIGVDDFLRLAANEIDDFESWLRVVGDERDTPEGTEFDEVLGL